MNKNYCQNCGQELLSSAHVCNEPEQMPEMPELKDGEYNKNTLILLQYASKLEAFCSGQTEIVKELEKDNDILRDDARKKLLDYLTMRNKAERLEEEKMKAVEQLESKKKEWWDKEWTTDSPHNEEAHNRGYYMGLECALDIIKSVLSSQEKGNTP